jgi:hypothetical protein
MLIFKNEKSTCNFPKSHPNPPGALISSSSPDPILPAPELFPHPYICVKTREFPWPVGPAATPCVTALPPGSPKCAGGWPPHARRARARVLASRLLPSPLPQAAAVPLHCTCPCASGHPPSTPARQSPLTGRRGSSGWGSRSVEAEVPEPQRLFLCLI